MQLEIQVLTRSDDKSKQAFRVKDLDNAKTYIYCDADWFTQEGKYINNRQLVEDLTRSFKEWNVSYFLGK